MIRKRFFALISALCATSFITACSSGSDDNVLSGEPSNCEVSGQSFGIVGGDVLGSGNDLSSSTVLVINVNYKDEASTCTGTLIGENTVLTAAHCIDAFGGKTAVAFSNNVECAAKALKRTVRKVSAKKAHPKFSYFFGGIKNASYDLAVLKFEGATPTGYTARPLPENKFEPTEQDSLVVTGYGDTYEQAKNSGVLRFTTVPATLLLTAFYVAKEKENVSLENTWIMDQPEKGVCKGDSGGPLYVQSHESKSLTLIGITSMGVDNRTLSEKEEDLRVCHGVSLFTDVRAHLDWIKEQKNSL